MSLFSALNSSVSALSAIQNALSITQNNIDNSSTAGYARQDATFEALPFEPGTGETGGVKLGPTQDSRDQFAETNVQTATSSLGYSERQVESLTALQDNFDISGASGVPAALSGLYTAFSGWANAPSNATTQQAVLTAANNVASAFNTTAQQVSKLGTDTDTSISSVTSAINRLASQLSSYNAQIVGGNGSDSGIQSGFYEALQSLSALVNVTTIRAPDGTLTVLLGNGQTPLVSGTTATQLHTQLYVTPPPPAAATPPLVEIATPSGTAITSQITGGQLAGLLNVRNTVLPGIQGGGGQTGSLNTLASAFADRINGLQKAAAPTGAPLFAYNPDNPAASLAVASGFTGAQLVAGDGTTSNGNALALADLSSSTKPESQVAGQSYTAYFGSIAASIGSQLAGATTDQSAAQDNVTQATSLRQQVSGVDLNQEAAQILQFQSSYTAASKVVTVIDELTQNILALIAPAQ